MNTDLNTTARWTVTEDDADYPAVLRDLPHAPEVIYGYGNRDALADLSRDRAVAIVGSRHASAYGREVAFSIAHDLASDGYTIVSGLNLGVDGAAHRGTLHASGRTIAVVACGPDVPNPTAHRLLLEQIAVDGCVISCQPFGSEVGSAADAQNLLGALVGFAFIAEGGEGSYAETTLGLAAHAGATIGAVPGPVTSPLSDGPNALLAKGHRMIRNAADVVAALSDAAVA